jgi:hypothetical protein
MPAFGFDTMICSFVLTESADDPPLPYNLIYIYEQAIVNKVLIKYKYLHSSANYILHFSTGRDCFQINILK